MNSSEDGASFWSVLSVVVIAALLSWVLVREWQGTEPVSLDGWVRPRGETADAHIGPCRVRKVIDGDTFDVSCDEFDDRVRLLRIDTPERDEAGYATSTAALRALVQGNPVHLDFEEAGQMVRGKYGRVLAYAYVGETHVNLEMVRKGWSVFDDRFGGGRHQRAFRDAEREARGDRRGIWGMNSR